MKPPEQAFDAVAADYDQQFSFTETGSLQRARVHRYLRRLISRRAPARVLELNCGTGEDAVFLARQGLSVLATDSSAKMCRVAEAKIRDAGLTERVSVRRCAIGEIGGLQAGQNFDWVFSNFGGLNCIAPAQLPPLRDALSSLLAPGGHFVAVLMPRFCLWESLYFLSRGRGAQAFRRLSRGAVQAPLQGASLPIWYYSPREFARQFAPDFEIAALRPVGFALPPSYLQPFFSRRRRLLRVLEQAEGLIGDMPFLAGLSDHCLIHLQKR